MVKEVHADSFVLNSVPYRFEAGTPNIEGVIGLAAALDYLGSLGLEQVAEHECSLVQRAKQRLSAIPRVQLLGPPPGVPCAPIVAFQIEGLSANAVAKALGNRANIIVRAGFHCAQPAHDTLGVGPTVRASFGLYNTFEDVDQLAATLESICALIH
jgi:cysteine desulfurase/selenocysteine lyase